MYNDFAAIDYMLLEKWSKGKLVARQPSLPTMLQPLHVVIDPSTTHPTAMVGSLLMEGGAMGPGEELRRSPIEISGEGVGVWGGEGRGMGGTEEGTDVDGLASRLGATPIVIVQNEPMHP